jgi:hypothetical protein
MLRLLAAVVALLTGCRGTPPARGESPDLSRLVDSMRPVVERATGQRFKGPTRSALKTREEVRTFLLGKLEQDFPPARQEGVEAVYRLLGLIPDSLDLKKLLLDLYTEQVAGFYDPEAATLYGVIGANPAELRFVLAHELVHALQHQYLPLDSLMRLKGSADEQTAVQAVLEGQATVASILAFVPNRDILRQPGFWDMARDQVRTQAASMQVFSRAPLAIREGLVFPYLGGAEFMRWWDSAHAGQPLPTLATMPRSTEQILHPERYANGDGPVPVRFADPAGDALYEDTFGELEIQTLATVLRGGGEVLTGTPIGWGGDRFRVYRSAAGPALVWYLVWDDEGSARRFQGTAGVRLLTAKRPGYRTTVEAVSGGGKPTVRIVIAPDRWERWKRIPRLGNGQ